MSYNQIIFWKWDDSDFQNDIYLKKIDDIGDRSVFDTVLVALTWCKPSIYEQAGHDAIKAAALRANERGMKLLLDIDVRPARKEFFKRYPDCRLCITQPVEVKLDSNGCATGEAEVRKTGDHYGDYYPGRARLLRAYAFQKIDDTYDSESLTDISSCEVTSTAPGEVRVDFSCAPWLAGMDAIAFVAFEYDYPDLFSDEMVDFHAKLIDSYADVPLAGASVDEWGAFPYPGFDFSGAWRRPWYSDAFAEKYAAKTGRDLILDYLNTRFAPSNNPAAQLNAINDYYNLLRERNVEIEGRFYDRVKSIWGKNAFVGVHPTWFAIEEIANTPEIWKNGFDWWDVKRDYGQTDEIAIYPVRTSLAHKWGGAVFYNMWYSMGSLDIKTYWEEAWENLRWGGRTHTLSYECRAESAGVMEISGAGDLESVSAIEELIMLANQFQKTAVKSHVAVVMGYPAMVNWKLNVPDGWLWNTRECVFCEGFQVAQDLFKAGYICDLIPSYEIEDDDLQIADGKVSMGSETYDALVYVRPELSTIKTLNFLKSMVSADYPLAVLGRCDTSSEGEDVTARFADIVTKARFFSEQVDSKEVLSSLEKWGISRNDVPNGARFQDGSVIICNKGKLNRGQELLVSGLNINGHAVDAVCQDAFGIALNDNGAIERLFAGALKEVRIDGKIVLQADEPRDIFIERTESGFRAAHVKGRELEWCEVDNLMSL